MEEEKKITRSQVDDVYKRNISKDSYKNRKFDGKRVTKDEYGGKDVYYSSKGEGKGADTPRHYSTERTSNTDHVTPTDVLIERFGKILSPEDIREIANSDFNLVITNEARNKRKGKQTNLEYLISQIEKGDPENAETTIKMLIHQLKSEGCITIELTKKGIQYIGSATVKAGDIILKSAQEAIATAAIPLVIRGCQDLVYVTNGDMTFKEAINDMGTLGLSIAASGGGTHALYALSTALQNSSNELIKNFAKANQIGNILVVASIVARATGKYIDGEVDGEGFFREISQDGMGLIAGMIASNTVNTLLIGSTLAGPAAAIAAMVASAVCQEIHAQAMKFVQEKKANDEIRAIAAAASRGIQEQQEELYRMMDESHAEWANEMNEIFQGIAVGLANNDLSQTNRGLRQLAKSYSEQVSLYDNGEDLIDDLISARNGGKSLHLLRGET